MVILLNPKSTPLRVQYSIGNKVYNKEVRPYLITGMEGLAVSGQIINKAALVNEGVTIYDYELNSYYNNGTLGQFTFGTAAPVYAFQYIGHNMKREDYTTYNSPTMSAGTITLQSLVA
jgi:hypothetical protein